jgi:hypothetical protein
MSDAEARARNGEARVAMSTCVRRARSSTTMRASWLPRPASPAPARRRRPRPERPSTASATPSSPTLETKPSQPEPGAGEQAVARSGRPGAAGSAHRDLACEGRKAVDHGDVVDRALPDADHVEGRGARGRGEERGRAQ